MYRLKGLAAFDDEFFSGFRFLLMAYGLTEQNAIE
jgi:hypothetical protein